MKPTQPNRSTEPESTPKQTPSAPTLSPSLTPAAHDVRKLQLTHHTGSLFTAPPNAVLIHACNTLGFWGSGIALAFKQQYPRAFAKYRSHCIHRFDPKKNPVPTGTCLLIPPCENPKKGKPASEHWIACLFTSAKTGQRKDKPDVILRNTARAVKDLLRKVKAARDGREGKGKEGMKVPEVGELWMCRINSGKFGVEWERTADVLQGLGVKDGEDETIQVWAEE